MLSLSVCNFGIEYQSCLWNLHCISTKHIQIHCDIEMNKKGSHNMNGMWLFYSSTDTIFRIGPHNRVWLCKRYTYSHSRKIQIVTLYFSQNVVTSLCGGPVLFRRVYMNKNFFWEFRVPEVNICIRYAFRFPNQRLTNFGRLHSFFTKKTRNIHILSCPLFFTRASFNARRQQQK